MTKFEFYEKVASMLAKSRTDANKSQEAMAALLGISRRTIQNWEACNCKPDPALVIKWFDVLHLNIVEYFADEFYCCNATDDLLKTIIMKLPEDTKLSMINIDKKYGLETIVNLINQINEVLYEK